MRKRWKFPKRNIIFLCLLMIFSMLLCAGVYAAEEKERDVIKVGFFAFDGYHMIDENGNRSGYGYDFLRLTARYIDVEYEYVGYENSWEDMLEMLRDGSIDMVTSAQITTEREEEFLYSKSIGVSSAMLTVCNENEEIIAGEYETYDGIRIGLLNDNSRNEDLEYFAKEKGFTYIPVYYDFDTELNDALQNGQVDAILTSSLRKMGNEKVLDTFDTHDFAILFRKEDTELLEKINYAIDQMNAVEGDWQNALKNLYYNHLDEKDLTFTLEEQKLINQYRNGEENLVVSVCTDKKPYAYEENGELKGILIDYFQALAEYVDIPYTVVVTPDRAEYQKWCTEENVVNVFLDGRFSHEQQAEEMGKALTESYVTMRLAKVTRRDFNGEIRTLAVSTAQGLFGIEEGLAQNAERLEVDSREAAMQAVLDGKADAAFVYLYTAQQFVNQDERGLLTYTMLEEPTYDYHVVFASSVDHALAGIFTKAIYAMPVGMIENIASEYTSYKAGDIDAITWIKIHPIHTLVVCVLIFIFVILSVVLWERQKAIKIEQKRSAQFQELAAMAESSNRAKTLFLNSMSHDIRTPMNAIIGFASLAASHLENPQQVKEYLQKISISSEHLLSLINDVLDMSQIESGKLKLDEQPLDLSELIDDICTMVQPTIDEKQLTFVLDTSDMRDKNIIADKLWLKRVLLNILSNSVKYNKVGGTVNFGIKQLKEAPIGCVAYEFKIQDTGIGMDQTFQEHLFEAFSRAQTTTVSGISGTGLGMTIVKNIVDLMDGSISVESQEGIGTEFVVTLNFKRSSENALKEMEQESFMQTKAEDECIFAGRKVLLVDDNQLNQEIAVALLEQIGLTVETANDGSKAVEIIKKAVPGQFDLIFMDIQMPIMDGYEATRHIRSLSEHALASIPIVAMTANAFSSDQEKAFECGMNGYLTKPVDMKKIEEMLRELLK